MITVLYLVGYLLFAYVTARIARETVMKNKGIALFIGLAWPLAFPMLILFTASLLVMYAIEWVGEKIL